MVFGHSDNIWWLLHLPRNRYRVEGVSEGKNPLTTVKSQLLQLSRKFSLIELDKFTSSKPIEDAPNHLLTKTINAEVITGYDATSRELAYRNIVSLGKPFYNKKVIVDQGNELAATSPQSREVLPRPRRQWFVTELANNADHISDPLRR